MDIKSRYALLGNTALQYAAQRYMLKYPQMEYEDIQLVAKLMSSRNFLRTSLSRSPDELGEFCHRMGIEVLEKEFNEQIGPKVVDFLGLNRSTHGQDADNENARKCTESSRQACQKPAEIVLNNTENRFHDHKHLNQPESSSLIHAQQAGLFDALSDEALLLDSAFKENVPKSVKSHEESREFDLLDADSWYRNG